MAPSAGGEEGDGNTDFVECAALPGCENWKVEDEWQRQRARMSRFVRSPLDKRPSRYVFDAMFTDDGA
jgi:hypothetical protein